MGSLADLIRRDSRVRSALLGAGSVVSFIVVMYAAVVTITVDRVDAVWTINGEVGEMSQAIPIRAAHPGCPSWSNLGGLVVTAVETDRTVTLSATFPERGEDTPCHEAGNPVRATIKLDEPLGDRVLVDGATGADPATPASLALYTGQPHD